MSKKKFLLNKKESQKSGSFFLYPLLWKLSPYFFSFLKFNRTQFFVETIALKIG